MSISKIRVMLLSLLLTLVSINVYADSAEKIEATVDEIAKKYDGVSGVEVISVTKGNGLEIVKMMFKKQFGKEFMRRVTSITIIGYSDAEAAVCESLRKDLDKFISVLEEFDLSGNKDVSEKGYSRCFARRTEAGTLSDFVIAMEQDLHKMVVYMAGEIVVE